MRVGPILIDRSAHRVTVENAELDLTPTEFKLLITLAERRGRVQSRALLLEIVWDAAPDIQTRTVDMHVRNVLRKLDCRSRIEAARRSEERRVGKECH